MTIEKKLNKFMVDSFRENKYLFLITFTSSYKFLFRILIKPLFKIIKKKLLNK